MGIFHKIFSYLGIGLAVFMLARLGIFAVHHENFSSLTFGEVFLGFFYGIRFDLASLLVISGIPLLLLGLPFRWASSNWWHGSLSLLVFFLLVLKLSNDS